MYIYIYIYMYMCTYVYMYIINVMNTQASSPPRGADRGAAATAQAIRVH